MTGWASRKKWTELVRSASPHCRTSNDIFSDGLMQETNRCNDATFSGINFSLSCDTKNSTEMVGMRMGVNNSSHWAMTKLCSNEVVTCASCCFGGQWVNNNPTFCSFYKSDVRNVVTTYLPHSVGYFKETMMCVELGVAPQAGVHSFWCRATRADEVIPIDVRHHAAGSISNAASGKGSNEAALGAVKVASI